jgi:sporulation protein YlmC with PRC-barrel domain
MNKLLSATALIALLAAAPVYAQDTSTPAPAEQPAANPDDPTLPADQVPPAATDDGTMNPADQPMDSTAQTDTMGTDDTATDQMATDQNITTDQNATNQTDLANAAPGFINNQTETQILATALIGQTVYNNAEESLGDINDVLIDTSGETLAVIIGVGGFLGIGEKNVAVPYAALQTIQDSDANLRLVLDANREEIENAPEFVRLQDQPSEPAPDTATTASTPDDGTMAPAEPMDDSMSTPPAATNDQTGNMNPDAPAPATNQ